MQDSLKVSNTKGLRNRRTTSNKGDTSLFIKCACGLSSKHSGKERSAVGEELLLDEVKRKIFFRSGG